MSLTGVDSATPAAESVSAWGADQPMTVLLVDDDADLRMMMALILEAGGCDVVEACDGEAALDLLRVHPLPNIVVTDLMMPVMSGMELIRRLRNDPMTAELPIVVVSGNVDSAEGAEVSPLASAMVDKAIVVNSLMATVRSVAAPRGIAPTAEQGAGADQGWSALQVPALPELD